MTKRVAIVQPCYVPWKGYFDLINSVDEFILYDTAQYTKRDWRNRNRIKTPHGLKWITIPVSAKGRYRQLVSETMVHDHKWSTVHWRTLVHNYGSASHFEEFREVIESSYRAVTDEPMLASICHQFLETVCRLLGIRTQLTWASDYSATGTKTAALISLCKAARGSEYLSGPRGREYLDETLFAREAIRVSYFDYSGYPAYAQLHGAFEHSVSILDLLFNTGREAQRYMKSFRRDGSRE